jgi:hypothetical protein
MRRNVGSGVVLMVVLLSNVGSAQLYQWRTPPPQLTAQNAEWQFTDEPIVVNGLIYHPTKETRFFDGQIMAQVAVYRSVPVYADVTLEPNSVAYVPVGRNLMRGYERRREGDLAGTQGSRVPAFPVEPVTSIVPREPTSVGVPDLAPASASPSVDLSRGPLAPAAVVKQPPLHLQTVTPPSGMNGIWLEFSGSRWYASGPAVSYSPDRFSEIGMYRGFPVYRDRNGSADHIWVRVSQQGGFVAPYVKR